jgi:hypothetical protein
VHGTKRKAQRALAGLIIEVSSGKEPDLGKLPLRLVTT